MLLSFDLSIHAMLPPAQSCSGGCLCIYPPLYLFMAILCMPCPSPRHAGLAWVSSPPKAGHHRYLFSRTLDCSTRIYYISSSKWQFSEILNNVWQIYERNKGGAETRERKIYQKEATARRPRQRSKPSHATQPDSPSRLAAAARLCRRGSGAVPDVHLLRHRLFPLLAFRGGGDGMGGQGRSRREGGGVIFRHTSGKLLRTARSRIVWVNTDRHVVYIWYCNLKWYDIQFIYYNAYTMQFVYKYHINRDI